jgi:hypothetical protein
MFGKETTRLESTIQEINKQICPYISAHQKKLSYPLNADRNPSLFA